MTANAVPSAAPVLINEIPSALWILSNNLRSVLRFVKGTAKMFSLWIPFFSRTVIANSKLVECSNVENICTIGFISLPFPFLLETKGFGNA